MKIRPIAMHLPQFHPFAENDKWWGKGFTEWTNVTKAKPLFEGHYQPHLPADLGYYDLRLEEARVAQAELAREYGIYGFCFYHYWFNGKLLMERPLEDMLRSKKPDFPFMLCWANENWSRAWDGSDKEILIKQDYHVDDDREHIQYLIPFFLDERYIRVDGKPVFVVYKSAELPNAKRTLEIWKEEAAKVGLELYICRMERWNTENGAHVLTDSGFDAAIDFQPLSPRLRAFLNSRNKPGRNNKLLSNRIVRKIKREFFPEKKPGWFSIDLEQYVDYDLQREPNDYKVYPGVSPSFDNTSRRKTAQLIFEKASPDLYQKWLTGKLVNFEPYSADENFLFINAWNEWAEGNHLEPCQKWGRGFLEATKDALAGAK